MACVPSASRHYWPVLVSGCGPLANNSDDEVRVVIRDKLVPGIVSCTWSIFSEFHNQSCNLKSPNPLVALSQRMRLSYDIQNNLACYKATLDLLMIPMSLGDSVSSNVDEHVFAIDSPSACSQTQGMSFLPHEIAVAVCTMNFHLLLRMRTCDHRCCE